MDDKSLEKMAARVAGVPETDHVHELEQLIAECRSALGRIASGVVAGTLLEESVTRSYSSMQEKARGACDGMRSCLHEMEAILPRRRPEPGAVSAPKGTPR